MTTRFLPFTAPRRLVAVLLLGLLALAARPAVDRDTWWHLRAGAWMTAEAQVLEREVFTSTVAGQPWTYPAWLGQTGLYLVYARFGLAGLNALTALGAVAAFALVYAATRGAVAVRVLAVLLGAAAAAVGWAAGPQVASLVLGAAFLLILRRFRREGRNHLWLLPPLMALWANLDPGFLAGFLFLALVLAGETLRALLGQQSWRAVGGLAGVGALCGLALLLTPYGPDFMLWPWQWAALAPLRTHLTAFQPPDFHVRAAQVFLLLWLLTLAAAGYSRQPIDPTDFLLFGGTFYLALLARGQVALFALVAPPILSEHATAALTALRANPPLWLARWWPPVAQPARWAGWLSWLLLVAVAVVALLRVGALADPARNAQHATAGLPVAAVDYLAAADLPGPLFHPLEWGGYLAWRLYPEQPVFIDSRPDLYAAEFLTDYRQLAAGTPEWAALLARYAVRLVLAPPGSALAELLAATPGWTERYADATAVVLSRP